MRSIHQLLTSLSFQGGSLPGAAGFTMPSVRVIVSAVLVAGLELAIVVGIAAFIHVVLTRGVRRVEATGRESVAASARSVRARMRTALIVVSALLAGAILAWIGWLAARGVDPGGYTIGLLASISAETWMALAIASVKLAVTVIGFLIAMRLVRRGLGALERAVNRWDRVWEND